MRPIARSLPLLALLLSCTPDSATKPGARLLPLEPASDISPEVWRGPIVITQGGTYSGWWRSTDPAVPAVRVLTSAPVTIRDCRIQSAGDGIWSLDQRARLVVRNCYGRGLNPNIAGRQKGKFIDVGIFTDVTVEDNTIEEWGAGMRALNYGHGLSLTGQRLIVRRNKFVNVDGRLSDGRGGYLLDLAGSGTNAVGLNSLRSADVEIAWNQVVNAPWKSRVEDLISTYGSSGTALRPIHVHDNYLQGGYAPDPTAFVDYSGALINLGDWLGDVGFTHVHHNQIVSFENAGLGISAGHDNDVHDNRIISAQRASDGSILGGNWRTGLGLWDYYGGAPFGWFFNNRMHANAVNVVYRDGTRAGDVYAPSLGGTNTITGTFDPFPGRLTTQADEVAEFASWQAKLAVAGVRVGCSRSSPRC